MSTAVPSVTMRPEGGRAVARLAGDWTVWTAAELGPKVAEAGRPAAVDLSGLRRLDLAGAYLVLRLAAGAPIEGASPEAARLIEVARSAADQSERLATTAPTGLRRFVETVGRGVAGAGANAYATLSFLGWTLVVLARLATRPKRFRSTSLVATLETAGLDAAGIVAFLSFFVGLVVAYVGVSTLSDFGLELFTVEAVGVGVLREFAVVITAVLLAGRTASAFAAEIGAMKMRQEIDAMRVLGLDPMERLVAPRVLAMTIATPLLTFAAMIAGLAGGLLVAWVNLGVSPVLFITRLQDNVPAENFFIGLIKAPVFGFVLALVACRHGLAVGGDVASLGRETTAAVVEAIFWVIVLDAVFAIFFLELGW